MFWILASFLAPAQNEQAPLSGKVETFDEKNGPALDSGQSQKVLKMQLFSWQVSIHLKVLLPPQIPSDCLGLSESNVRIGFSWFLIQTHIFFFVFN